MCITGGKEYSPDGGSQESIQAEVDCNIISSIIIIRSSSSIISIGDGVILAPCNIIPLTPFQYIAHTGENHDIK